MRHQHFAIIDLRGERLLFPHYWKPDLRKTLRYRVTNNPHILQVPQSTTYLMTHPYIKEPEITDSTKQKSADGDDGIETLQEGVDLGSVDRENVDLRKGLPQQPAQPDHLGLQRPPEPPGYPEPAELTEQGAGGENQRYEGVTSHEVIESIERNNSSSDTESFQSITPLKIAIEDLSHHGYKYGIKDASWGSRVLHLPRVVL